MMSTVANWGVWVVLGSSAQASRSALTRPLTLSTASMAACAAGGRAAASQSRRMGSPAVSQRPTGVMPTGTTV